MKEFNNKFPGIYVLKTKRINLYTKNMNKGVSVYGETLVRKKGEEYRQWDPTRSKYAAALLKGVSQMGLNKGDSVLYLGASTGTTVSHISDILAGNGYIYALDFAPRVLRELVFLAETRKNIIPIMGDANQPETYRANLPKVDFLYQDVAQREQPEIFLKNINMFLKEGGFCVLCVKARSIDIGRKPKQIYQEVRRKLEKKTTIVDFRVLDPFEKDHCIFVCKNQ